MPELFADRIEADQQRVYGVIADEKGLSCRGNERMWPDYFPQSPLFRGGLGYTRKAYLDDSEAIRRAQGNNSNLSLYWTIRLESGPHPGGRGYGPPAYQFDNHIPRQSRVRKF